jgi:protein-tyrosine phosphatase
MENKIRQKCTRCKNGDETLNHYSNILLCEACYKIEKDLHFKIEKRKTFLITDLNKITDKIFLGNSDSAMDKELMKRYEITNILIIGAFLHEFFPEDFLYKTIEAEDSVKFDISKLFLKAFEFIDSAERVYVHCFAGVSRSPSIVIAYLMWKEKKDFFEIQEFVKSKRNCVSINNGFRKILLVWGLFLKKINFNLQLFEELSLIIMARVLDNKTRELKSN